LWGEGRRHIEWRDGLRGVLQSTKRDVAIV
jgi:hypothetical protein